MRRHRGEYTRHLALKFCEFQIDDRFARMQYDVDGLRQATKIDAHRLAHTPLDAVAIDSLAKYASGGKAHARSLRYVVELCAQAEEIAHRGREVLAASLVNTLIVR